MWQVGNIVSQYHVPSFSGLGFMMYWRFEGKKIAELLTYLFNYEDVCRTAPATPGLLITHPLSDSVILCEHIFKSPSLPNHELGTYVTCNASHVTCQMSCVICPLSGVPCKKKNNNNYKKEDKITFIVLYYNISSTLLYCNVHYCPCNVQYSLLYCTSLYSLCTAFCCAVL